jgi:hypothetical protein
VSNPSEWGPYPDTVLHFPQADLRVDLRRPVPADLVQSLRWLGLAAPFAVVTASNPLGVRLDESVNRWLAAVLSSIVRLRYPAAVPADGRAPDGPHVEPGWAISAPLVDARRLAAGFLQNALFGSMVRRFRLRRFSCRGRRWRCLARTPRADL